MSETPRTLATILNQWAWAIGDGFPLTIESRSSCGDRPLHSACIQGDTEAALILIDAGADVNALGEDGMTPLHYAARFRHHAIVEELIKAGADVTVRDDLFFQTPYDVAWATADAKLRGYFGIETPR